MSRSIDDFNHERQALDVAHAQNEAGRDAFVALAHTALFAASVSFVGDVAPVTQAVWLPALIGGWAADVVGLLALTFSFGAARRAIDLRRQALNEEEAPTDTRAERLNGIALWSFPVALLCLFLFATANMVQANGRQDSATHLAPSTAQPRDTRVQPSTASALPQSGRSANGCHPSAAGAGSAAACPSASPEEVSSR